MLKLSFHDPGKTYCEMQKMFMELYVQVREKARELFFRFLVGTLIFGKYRIYLCA